MPVVLAQRKVRLVSKSSLYYLSFPVLRLYLAVLNTASHTSDRALNSASKIVSMAVSTFTAHYIHRWPDFFPDAPLTPPLPTFDGRVILYPDATSLRDYMSWRQVDCTFSTASLLAA